MMNESASNKNLAKLQPHKRDRQKDASVQSEERTSQGHAVQWDRFLPFRSIRVLLVENNDSTRLLITALLGNCGYEVVAVRNGKEAWKIVEDQTNNINLVLTEVVTPSLPGVDLLSKIRRHKISKHIPVIMMSSNDCMSTVIKCLSKGAVDFLVKPIRKNELKNLWQHVWRICGTRRPEAFSREDECADVIPNDPSENQETEDRSGPIMKRQRIEGFTFRPSNFSAFTRYSASTNSRALVGNKEEDDMRSTDNNIFSEHEAEHYNHTHYSSEAAEEQVQVQHHYYHHHHHHHVHNNHHELLTGSANEQNSENYTTYSFSGSGSGNNSNSSAGGSGGPHQKLQLTQREIALNRFLEKRKKRCLDNKV